ncbi:hypothetical protein MSAN_01009900 [Mycena sanguinolenta]|uniref:Uncharacterized protein n=1 Tax=Mycena sanguinolenta TaxID=230812 RepID=A0A8H7D5Z1_9AGAR|nr:hypothetical protein MSAN_01009900 [Mycena sanguinolenta]
MVRQGTALKEFILGFCSSRRLSRNLSTSARSLHFLHLISSARDSWTRIERHRAVHVVRFALPPARLNVTAHRPDWIALCNTAAAVGDAPDTVHTTRERKDIRSRLCTRIRLTWSTELASWLQLSARVRSARERHAVASTGTGVQELLRALALLTDGASAGDG